MLLGGNNTSDCGVAFLLVKEMQEKHFHWNGTLHFLRFQSNVY